MAFKSAREKQGNEGWSYGRTRTGRNLGYGVEEGLIGYFWVNGKYFPSPLPGLGKEGKNKMQWRPQPAQWATIFRPWAGLKIKEAIFYNVSLTTA